MKTDISEILISEEEIAGRIRALGAKISEDYKGVRPLLIGILKGSVIFLSDLIREIKIPVSIDFMAVSSYRGASSSGVVRILKDLDYDISGRHVILVEDILDSGLTLGYLKNVLGARNLASLKLCCLLDKPARHKVDHNVDYLGFTVPNEFVVGYGLDYEEMYRNLPYIGILKSEVYEK